MYFVTGVIKAKIYTIKYEFRKYETNEVFKVLSVIALSVYLEI